MRNVFITSALTLATGMAIAAPPAYTFSLVPTNGSSVGGGGALWDTTNTPTPFIPPRTSPPFFFGPCSTQAPPCYPALPANGDYDFLGHRDLGDPFADVGIGRLSGSSNFNGSYYRIGKYTATFADGALIGLQVAAQLYDTGYITYTGGLSISGDKYTYSQSELVCPPFPCTAHEVVSSAGDVRFFTTAVPEPATYAALLSGLTAMSLSLRRRSRKHVAPELT